MILNLQLVQSQTIEPIKSKEITITQIFISYVEKYIGLEKSKNNTKSKFLCSVTMIKEKEPLFFLNGKQIPYDNFNKIIKKDADIKRWLVSIKVLTKEEIWDKYQVTFDYKAIEIYTKDKRWLRKYYN
jgi:hypothetical protein